MEPAKSELTRRDMPAEEMTKLTWIDARDAHQIGTSAPTRRAPYEVNKPSASMFEGRRGPRRAGNLVGDQGRERARLRREQRVSVDRVSHARIVISLTIF